MYEGCFLQTRLSEILNVSVDQRLGRAFASKNGTESLKFPAELLKHSSELLKHSTELLRVEEKTKSRPESLKSSAACLKSSAMSLCFNITHAVPISHGTSMTSK